MKKYVFLMWFFYIDSMVFFCYSKVHLLFQFDPIVEYIFAQKETSGEPRNTQKVSICISNHVSIYISHIASQTVV